MVRLKGVGQFGSDSPLNGPAGIWVHVRSEVGQRPGKGKTGGDGPSTAEDTGQHQRMWQETT